MRILAYRKETATGAVASSENEAEFPVENLFDNDAGNPYKAVDGVNRATLTLHILAGSDTAILSGTNAVTALMLIAASTGGSAIDAAAAVDLGSGLVGIPATGHGHSAGDIVLISGSTNYDAVYEAHSSTTTDQFVIEATYAAETFTGAEVIRGGYGGEAFDLNEYDDHDVVVTGEPYVQRSFGVSYTYQGSACVCYVTLTAEDGATLWAGEFTAASSVEISNPDYGLSEGLEDFHIRHDLLNGGKYGLEQKIARTFSGRVLLPRETKFYKIRNAVARAGTKPVGIMVTDLDGEIWSIIGYLNHGFSGSHDLPGNSYFTFSALEAV